MLLDNLSMQDIAHNGIWNVVRLPFKTDHELLPDNYNVSGRKLKSLEYRLIAKGLYDGYDLVFKDYEKNGIVDRVLLEGIAK